MYKVKKTFFKIFYSKIAHWIKAKNFVGDNRMKENHCSRTKLYCKMSFISPCFTLGKVDKEKHVKCDNRKRSKIGKIVLSWYADVRLQSAKSDWKVSNLKNFLLIKWTQFCGTSAKRDIWKFIHVCFNNSDIIAMEYIGVCEKAIFQKQKEDLWNTKMGSARTWIW